MSGNFHYGLQYEATPVMRVELLLLWLWSYVTVSCWALVCRDGTTNGFHLPRQLLWRLECDLCCLALDSFSLSSIACWSVLSNSCFVCDIVHQFVCISRIYRRVILESNSILQLFSDSRFLSTVHMNNLRCLVSAYLNKRRRDSRDSQVTSYYTGNYCHSIILGSLSFP
jgi:hypothetical protein